MKMHLAIIALAVMASAAHAQNKPDTPMTTAPIVCKLTTPELQQRKKTVIAELKNRLLQRVETTNGMKYKFDNTDQLIDLVTDFIKTERLCCSFFDFSMTIGADTGALWLELSGPEGVKEFIKNEIEF